MRDPDFMRKKDEETMVQIFPVSTSGKCMTNSALVHWGCVYLIELAVPNTLQINESQREK